MVSGVFPGFPLALSGLCLLRNPVAFFLAPPRRNYILAGAALGCLSETKLPLLSPVLMYLGTVILLRREKQRLVKISLFLASASLFYLIPYIPYFFSGHTLIEWLRVQ